MLKNNRAKALRTVNLVLTVGVFYFAFVYGRDLISKADFSGLRGHYPVLALSFLLFVSFYAALSLHWLMVCRLVRKDTEKVQALAFAASQPYKYLPTSIFTFSYRAKYAKQLGLSVKDSSYAQLIENFDIIGGGAVVCAVFWLASVSYWWGAAAALLFSLAAYVAYANKKVLAIYRTRISIPLYRLIPAFCLVLFAWLLSGLAFLLVNYSLGIHPSVWLAIAANAGAYAASILVVFVPGGIGVRELVLAAFSIGNAPIVLWRLLTFAADMLIGFGSVLYIYISRRAASR